MTLVFEHPQRLALLLLALPIVWLGARYLVALDPIRKWTAIAARLVVLAAITLILAGAQAVQRHDDLTVAIVMDVSDSVRRFADVPGDPSLPAEARIARFLEAAGDDARPDDRFVYVVYDGRPRIAARATGEVRAEAGTVVAPVEGTHTAAAIRQALAAKPDASSAMRLVLVTDGNDTAGDTLAAVLEAVAAGVEVDLVPVRYRIDREVFVDRLNVRLEAREGQTVRVTAVLRATRPSVGTFELLHDGTVAGTTRLAPRDWTRETDPAEADAGAFVAQVRVDVPLFASGRNVFNGRFVPDAGEDEVPSNNDAQAFTFVQGQGRVLFVDNVGGDAGAVLPDRLTRGGLLVDRVGPAGVPDALSALQRYDAVVLQNVPASLVSGPQQEAIANAVREMGLGLVIVGGDEAFGAGAWNNTPIDDISPVTAELPSQRSMPSGALMIVIDRSGSMGAPVGTSDQQTLANEAAILAINTLYPEDLVGVVAFDSSVENVVPLQRNVEPAEAVRAVARIRPGGGTSIYPAVQHAVNELIDVPVAEAAVRHIVLLTDGNDGTSIQQYAGLINQMRANGISISTIAVGDAAATNTQLLEQLALAADGEFHAVTDANNLPQVFIKEAQTIRKNLIRETPFLPVLEPTNSPITAGLPDLPQLGGLVLTGMRDDPRVNNAITGPEGEPVFAHWSIGLGQTAAFTADATTRWGADWVPWNGYDDFWLRTVRQVSRPSASRDVDLRTRVDGEHLVITLDTAGLASSTTDNAADFANALQARGAVIGPDETPVAIDLNQTGPGLYTARVPAPQTGSYLVYLDLAAPDGTRRSVFGGASRPPGDELRRLSSNDGLFPQIIEASGGRLIELTDTNTPGLYERTRAFDTRSMRPLWRRLMPWLLALLLLDVALRRIAWDPAGIAARIRGTASAKQSEDAAATARAMKNVRDRTAGQLNQPTPARGAAARQPNKPTKPRKAAAFEASNTYRAADDLTSAVGGASTGKPAPPQPRPRPAAEANDDTPSTSRLLAARRAREKGRDDGE